MLTEHNAPPTHNEAYRAEFMRTTAGRDLPGKTSEAFKIVKFTSESDKTFGLRAFLRPRLRPTSQSDRSGRVRVSRLRASGRRDQTYPLFFGLRNRFPTIAARLDQPNQWEVDR